MGTTIYNWATGLYDGTCTATGMVSTTTYSMGNASLYCNGSNYLTINSSVIATNSTANAAGFLSNGFNPNNGNGYTFTGWMYNTGGSWGQALYMFLNSGTGGPICIALVPGSRTMSGISNYNPSMPPWGEPFNSWVFFAVVYPSGSVTQYNNYTVYINGASVSVTPQVSGVGTIAGGPYNIMRLGYNSGAGYVANPGYFQGYIDDFRVYATALTSTQISALYNKQNPL